MAPRQGTKLETLLDQALTKGDVKALEVFLQREICEGTSITCSQQFLSKLDKFVKQSLHQSDLKSASLGLAVLYKCGKNLQLPGRQGLPGIIAQGLIKKWFEKCRQLWIQCGPHWDEALLNLSEDLFDALMVVHEACKEGTYKVTESFLYLVGQLGVDSRIYILIQKEAIRKFNHILGKIPTDLKKERKILTTQEASDIMLKMAGQILKCGDYDMQTALMEALCRMANPQQRKQMADRWFSMEHVAKAFAKICDSEFETDCRKFLNLVNGMQGHRRRVYSYPCLEVYLDKHELLMPEDEKLDAFWIDFNLGSHSISFYFSLADENTQEGQWETICIHENEVQSYTVADEGSRKILHLNLSEVVMVSALEGLNLTIHFSSSLGILEAARSVYGYSKNKSFVGKTSTCVAKTIVKVLMEENGSQVVPESQVSLGENEKNTSLKLLPALSEQIMTPAKRKISEASTLNCTGRKVRSVISISSVTLTGTPSRIKQKPSLEMVPSSNRKDELCLGDLKTTAKKCSHGMNTGVTKEQNTPIAKPTDMVLSRQGKERSVEESFVPDTKPRTGINISSNLNKVSISEILMMPTQKINTQRRTEALSALVKEQEYQSLAQHLPAPGSGPVIQKQFHTRLTRHLQQVVSEKSQECAPQESPVPQRTKSDIRGDSKVVSSADKCALKLYFPKDQQTQKCDLAKGRRKGQVPREADAASNKVSVKASASKAIKDTIPPNVKANGTLSSKEKHDAEFAGSMVKLISSHYKSNTRSTAKDTGEKFPQNPLVERPSFNISWVPAAKRDVSKTASLTKSHTKTSTNSRKHGKDIFAFNDYTPSSIRVKDKPVNNLSDITISNNHDSSVLHRTAKKEQPVKKEKRCVKKHLFSETDTDCALTEVSWLRESSRKPKPKVIKYTRKVPLKRKDLSLYTSDKSGDFSPSSPKHLRRNTNKKGPGVKDRMGKLKTVKPATAPNRPHAAQRRPRRAAATSAKSYKEPDTDDSQPETEKSLVPKQKPKNVQETFKLKRSVVPVSEKMKSLKHSLGANETSACLSLPSFESMRSAEGSDPTLDLTCSPLRGFSLPASPELACQDILSPILLLPKPHSIVSSKGTLRPLSPYSADKKHSTLKTQSIQSFHSLPLLAGQTLAPDPPIGPSEPELRPIQHCLSRAPPCPQPLLSSTFELDKPSMHSLPQSPFPEDIANCGHHYGFSTSAVFQDSVSHSSTKSSRLAKRVRGGPTTGSRKMEQTPCDLKPAQLHMSGPCSRHHISSSNSEEDENEKSKKSKRSWQYSRMKPRKLFKSFNKVSAEGDVSSAISTSHTVSFSHWEDNVGDGTMNMVEDLEPPKTPVNPSNLCQQFSSELKKKFKDRFKVMEFYNKEFMKTAQQHMSSFNVQVNKYRSQSLEQVKMILLEEIRKLELNNTVLKDMEKNLASFSKKQAMTFHSYQEQETRSNETLKKALQSNLCPSLAHEQKIFTSQMCLMRKDMKSVQERLLCEMQEGEIQSVKRGVCALFFPEGAMF